MDYKDETGKIHSETLDDLAPGEPFFVLRGTDPHAILLLRRKLKRGGRDGLLSVADMEDIEATIKEMGKWKQAI